MSSLKSLLVSVAALVASAGLVQARLPDGRLHANMKMPPSIPLVSTTGLDGPVTSRNGTELPPYTTVYYFDQLIDHNNPSLGTFQQRYWHTYEFYEQGGPIILMTPGEANASPYYTYLTNKTINGLIAQQQNGSTIVLEHRFFGLSNPKPDLTVESLKFLNLQQSVDDLAYFANNVHLPMPNGDKLSPAHAPWVLVGGSYSGALTSWTMYNKPGVFWAGYASSAVVEAILDFWEYFEPVRQNMPQNCSADVEAVIQYIDQTFTSSNTTRINEIKDLFGMSSVSHLDDAAGALRNNLWDWQSLQPTTGPNGQFFQFCDALEVKNGQSASASGWGLDYALNAWGNYFKNVYYQILCGNLDAEVCLGTYDATQSYYTNTTIDNANRSWFWFVCNEVGYLQEGAPLGTPTLASRLIQPPYDLRQCELMFPGIYPGGIPIVKTQRTNGVFGGWNVHQDRLFFATGLRDPWREATMSAAPVTVKSSAEQPIEMSDGFHCSDLRTAAGVVDSTVLSVQNGALGYMKTWLAEWSPPVSYGKRDTPRALTSKPVNAWFRMSE
ncbi:hypothetical protein M378DRAFT_158717 [Amanita muscaria Koide BX008]|uniref:Uncharacterized protein n=1 Tax=Amanita muscaria (strain Koide BX008) TaxID=946122 RepID=A0A0C2XGW0_AMAMK|nr:hypothetical protein M378DRAFT_158717 [Amanita muscaria Koide BX008]